jgi:hypothetical protein
MKVAGNNIVILSVSFLPLNEPIKLAPIFSVYSVKSNFTLFIARRKHSERESERREARKEAVRVHAPIPRFSRTNQRTEPYRHSCTSSCSLTLSVTCHRFSIFSAR